MRLYFEVAKRAFRQTLTYRAAALAGLFTNSVFGVFIATIYVAFYNSAEGGSEVAVAGWTVSQTVTLTWISQSLIMVIFIWGWWEVALSVQSGAVVSDMIKPMNYFGYWLSRDLGRAAAHVLVRMIPTFAIGAMLFDLEAPDSLSSALAFPASIALATALSFTWRFLLNVSVFWLLDYRGINALALAIINVLSGFLIPIAFFPDLIRPVIEKLPFRGIVQMPSEIYLGQTGIWQGLVFQVLWLSAMVAFALWVFNRATRKVVIQGG
jgi:ABC-2 type transport system permease protein